MSFKVLIFESFSVTLLTSLSHEIPVFISLRNNSNNQSDFFNFLCEAIQADYLKKDDILILDNSAVHKCKLIKEEMDELLALVGFKIVFLPTYSPEVCIFFLKL